MNTNRMIVVGASVVALLVLVGGAYLLLAPAAMPGTVAPSAQPMAATPSTRDAASKAADTPELARLRQENDLLKQQLDNLRQELSDAKRSAAVAAAQPEPDSPAAEEPEGDEIDLPVGGGDDGNRDRERRREEREQWSEERAAQFRAQVDQFYEDALASADTPEAQERITSIRDMSQQMMDLRQQIRAAEDDTTRDALREEMDALREEMRPLVRDQQDYLLQQAAASAGVNHAGTQRKLADALRDTLRSPFFMPGFGSGRGPDGGGGRGGGGRGPGNTNP